MTTEKITNLLSGSHDIGDCLSNCSNHGLCVLTNDNKFVCSCEQNFGGQKCQMDLRPCSSGPCLNNGTCYDHTVNSSLLNSFLCECDQYHYGTNCEMSIDVCVNETCSNKGICYDVGYQPTCKCFKFYSGEKCEIESSEMKTIKAFLSTSSIIAICILIGLYILFFLCDIARYFDMGKQRIGKRNPQVNKIRKFVYTN